MARIKLVSPTRSTQIENMLLQMVQSGRLRGSRVTEQQLIDLLEQVRFQAYVFLSRKC